MSTIGQLPTVASHEAWLAARKELLAQEKALTRQYDEVSTARRQLPMVRIDKQYTLQGANGPVSLRDLFDGREQLVVHHVMWSASWDQPCTSCASLCDAIPPLRQLHLRNTSLAAVSAAPYATLAPFARRMGWSFPWFSSAGSDFNADFFRILRLGAPPTADGTEAKDDSDEMPGISVFLRTADAIYLTYASTARGLDLLGESPYLDLTALGRQEPWEKPAGRAKPLGLEAGGPAMRLPDEIEDPGRRQAKAA